MDANDAMANISTVKEFKETFGENAEVPEHLLAQEKRDTFEEACKPLIKWLNDNMHPHAKVIVETDGAELVSGEMSMKTVEFIRD